MNAYLIAAREKYAGIRNSVSSLQTQAATEKRDLNEVELELVRKQGDAMEALAKEIDALTAIELRDAKVDKAAADLSAAQAAATNASQPGDAGALGGQGTPEVRGAIPGQPLGATTNLRDPGHYMRGNGNSFFGDIVRARESGDTEAVRRLGEHGAYQTRAAGLTTGSNGPGVVPPKWLVDEFAEIARQGRALANMVRNIPLGDDPRPMTLPKQTAGTDSVILAQTNENDALTATDVWDSDVDTVSPKPIAGAQVVSRQMIDMSNPAIDQLIYSDMLSAYNLKIEKLVGAAITAAGTSGGGAALAAQEGDTVPVTAQAHYARQAVKAAIQVRKNRKLGANLFAMSVGRYGEFLDLRDTTGRPLVPEDSPGQAMNVMGIGSVNVDGRYRGLAIVATEGMLNDLEFAAVRSTDVLLFESDMLRFRYEEVLGPQSIKLGVWAYSALLVRYGNAPVKLVDITEES